MSTIPDDMYEMPEEPPPPQAALRTSEPSQHPKDDPGTNEPSHQILPPDNNRGTKCAKCWEYPICLIVHYC